MPSSVAAVPEPSHRTGEVPTHVPAALYLSLWPTAVPEPLTARAKEYRKPTAPFFSPPLLGL
ncbi:MAG TPA: hypothetical protein VGR35_17255 [Tepidisphaeraceae bacterium]|nr:hypothetical protein [Tepidisphaeraceae bacterium]